MRNKMNVYVSNIEFYHHEGFNKKFILIKSRIDNTNAFCHTFVYLIYIYKTANLDSRKTDNLYNIESVFKNSQRVVKLKSKKRSELIIKRYHMIY